MHDTRIENQNHRTLPGMHSAVGPIYIGEAKALIMPLPIALMMSREFAYRAIDAKYSAQSSAARRVFGDDAEVAHTQLTASLIGTFAVLGQATQIRFFAELLRHIDFHKDATGLEGLLITCIQSIWHTGDLEIMSVGLAFWERYGRRGQYASTRVACAYNEPTRTLRAFLPGEIAALSADEGVINLLRVAIGRGQNVDPRESLAGKYSNSTNPAVDLAGQGYNGVFPGVGGEMPDPTRTPGGAGTPWGELPGPGGRRRPGIGGDIVEPSRTPGGSLGSLW
jgi:hypothetical protein